MTYYNSSMAEWEPLIEQNEVENPNGLWDYHPWELNFDLKIENQTTGDDIESE